MKDTTTRYYSRGLLGKFPENLTPQAETCYKILMDLLKSKHSVSEEELGEGLKVRVAELKTRQDPLRIFSYYKNLLITSLLMIQD